MNTEQLIKAGGSEWKAGTKHRVYFNDLAAWYGGIEIDYYNTGNVRSAVIDGEEVSNKRASLLIETLTKGRVFYDVATQTFSGQGVSQEMLDRIVAAIKAKIKSIE